MRDINKERVREREERENPAKRFLSFVSQKFDIFRLPYERLF